MAFDNNNTVSRKYRKIMQRHACKHYNSKYNNNLNLNSMMSSVDFSHSSNIKCTLSSSHAPFLITQIKRAPIVRPERKVDEKP